MNKLLLALLLAIAPTAFASIWYVDGVHGSDSNDCKTRQTACKTIGHAISLASPGDTIGVGPATYTENLTISISLKIIGANARTTIVDGNQSGTVFTISAGSVLLSRLTIQNGNADVYGGGIENDDVGTLTVSMCTITGNSVGGYGGGIANDGTLRVRGSTITGNSAEVYGGGIVNLNSGTLAVDNSTVTENSNPGGYGGGILNFEGKATINNSTITGNSSDGYGGGILNFEGTATVNNSTITGNNSNVNGGGIVNFEGTATVSNSTITGNSGGEFGGGLVNIEATATTLQNTIVGSNSPNCYGTVASEGYNLSDDNSCNFNGPGDMNNTKPLLGTLGNNGGPTQTIPELPGSPTIDAGNPSGCTNSNGQLLTIDQRGYPRPGKYKHDKRCDIGAYERQTD